VDPDRLLPFLFIAIFLVLFAAVLIGAKKQSEKAHANLTRMAQRMGWAPPEPFKASLLRSSPMALAGAFRGRQMRVFTYTTGSGKNRTHWCAIAARVDNAAKLTLRLGKENALTRFGRKFGLDDVSVGNAAFDEEFYVKSNKPEFISVALIPEIRQRIGQLWHDQPRGAIEVEGGEVKFSESGTFANDSMCDRFIAAAEVICDIAEVADACPA